MENSNWICSGDPTNPDFSSTNDTFVPVVLQLSPAIDLTKAHLRLTYDSSDPAGVTSDDGSPAQWTPGGGSLRLWKKPANQPRDFHSAEDPNTPGDYLPGQWEVYSNLTQLGSSSRLNFLPPCNPATT
jgi:hypothetical protein